MNQSPTPVPYHGNSETASTWDSSFIMLEISINHSMPPADSLPNILKETEEETHSLLPLQVVSLNYMLSGTPLFMNMMLTLSNLWAHQTGPSSEVNLLVLRHSTPKALSATSTQNTPLGTMSHWNSLRLSSIPPSLKTPYPQILTWLRERFWPKSKSSKVDTDWRSNLKACGELPPPLKKNWSNDHFVVDDIYI